MSTAEQQADHEHLLTVQSRHPQQLNCLLRNFYRRDAFYYIRADPWYNFRWLLDLSGSASIWVGALLYNVSCVCLCYEVRPMHGTHACVRAPCTCPTFQFRCCHAR